MDHLGHKQYIAASGVLYSYFFVDSREELAGTTGLEPATSDVTGRRSNQLNYVPAIFAPRICGARQVGDFQHNTCS